jgi:ketosteroid isomerase-like protein
MDKHAVHARDVNEETVLKVTGNWRAAALAGEVEAYVQFLADDAVFLAPNLEPSVGKAAVANFVRGVFAWRREAHDVWRLVMAVWNTKPPT